MHQLPTNLPGYGLDLGILCQLVYFVFVMGFNKCFWLLADYIYIYRYGYTGLICTFLFLSTYSLESS